jgi:uncharacterized protein
MSAYIINSEPGPAPAEGLKGTMQRHPVISYCVIIFTGLWLAYIPLLLSEQGFGVLKYRVPFPPELFNLPASVFGPLLAGLVMSWVVGGKEGRREFVKRLFRFRVGVQWYLLPLIAVPVLGVLSVSVVQGFTPINLFVSQISSFIVPYISGTLLLAVLINLWEESGQMAFLLPHLQRRTGPVVASLIIAPIWALMHLPAFFVPDLGVGVAGPLSLEGVALSMGVLIVYAIPVRILATWLYNSAGQSVVIVALFHAAMNSVQGQLQQMIPGYNTFYMLGAFGVVCFVLIAVTRGKLGYKREEQPATYQGDVAQPAAAPL